ncbi:cO dehydrogenase/acetyl-CoA synthase complex delta subunit [Brachyspira sp. CAG:484]|nr:cO dehydrogenase/acetyl-CoA synthase complex delta subunit [Brachyspira sp. CAG:484]
MKEKTLNKIRTINFQGLSIGNSRPFLCLEFSAFTPDAKIFAQRGAGEDTGAGEDIFGIRFDIQNETEIAQAKESLKELMPLIKKPLMIRGSGNDSIDKNLLPELIKILDRETIIAHTNENTYKDIIPLTANEGHVVVLRSPIDINLAKEINILAADLGQSLDKILIDTDIGGLGYGLEYGYSIMEKIKLEGLGGDDYLNMPMISFAAEESLKTKEAKSDTFSPSWGNLQTRAEMFELTSASAVIAAGADVVVLNKPQSVNILRGLFE